jgi:hypothetical protein
MTDIEKFFKTLFFKESENWFFSHVPAEQTPEKMSNDQLVPGEHYLRIDLKSLRIVDSRKAFSKFYGVVHSFIKVPHFGTDDLEFHVVTTPSNLTELDYKHADHIIPVNIPLLGEIPYLGSGLTLQLALCSVKSTDLTAPVIALLSDMSATAGVSFISSALPYAKFLNRGLSILTGTDDNTVLEIGISTTLRDIRTGYYVIMRAPASSIDLKDVRITSGDFRLTTADGRPFRDHPYLVFEVSAIPNRIEWYKIPELKSAYSRLEAAFITPGSKNIQKALDLFELAVFTSADLTEKDGQKIFNEVEGKVKKLRSLIGNTHPATRGLESGVSVKEHSEKLSLPAAHDLDVFKNNS